MKIPALNKENKVEINFVITKKLINDHFPQFEVREIVGKAATRSQAEIICEERQKNCSESLLVEAWA